MSDIECARCGNTAPPLANAPFPGALGRQVHERTCRACFREWLDAQVILINENRLDGADPAHVATLMDQMRTFLNLRLTDGEEDREETA